MSTRLDRTATAVTIIAELSHIFCCGLPILVAVVSAGTQAGLMGGFLFIHEWMHDYEVQILMLSGALLTMGLVIQYVSFWMDCRSTGCSHSDCTPKKMKVSGIFKIAVVLYAANLAFYFLSGHGLSG